LPALFAQDQAARDAAKDTAKVARKEAKKARNESTDAAQTTGNATADAGQSRRATEVNFNDQDNQPRNEGLGNRT